MKLSTGDLLEALAAGLVAGASGARPSTSPHNASNADRAKGYPWRGREQSRLAAAWLAGHYLQAAFNASLPTADKP